MKIDLLATMLRLLLFIQLCWINLAHENEDTTTCTDDQESCLINGDEDHEAKSVNIKLLQENLNADEIMHFEKFGYQFIGYNKVFLPPIWDPLSKFEPKKFFPITKDVTTFLDMGCGTGYHGIISLLKGGKYTLALDINKNAIKNVKDNAVLHGFGDNGNKFQAFNSDLFSILDDRSVDITHNIFDIMYFDIPWHNKDDTGLFEHLNDTYSIATTNDSNSNVSDSNSNNETSKTTTYNNLLKAVFDFDYQMTNKFLKDAKQYLRKETGIIYVELSSSVSDMKKFNQIVKDNGYNKVLYETTGDDLTTVEYWALSIMQNPDNNL